MRKIRIYDKEFKLNALELYTAGKTGTEIVNALGIPPSTFWSWLKQAKREGSESFVGQGKIKPANEELNQLKKELENTRLERDILKKALAIFSKTK